MPLDVNALSNKIIIETLIHARKYKLSDDFIAIIEKEIRSRGLDIGRIKLYKDNPTQTNR